MSKVQIQKEFILLMIYTKSFFDIVFEEEQ